MMPDAKPPGPQPPWSPEARTWVSLLLFAHLFAVVVAVTTYTRPSGLQEQLHALFAPYLRTLHLAVLPVSYPFARYHLTHASPSDVDFSCEVEFKDQQGSAERITLPDATLRPRVRYRRYQAMINAMGSLAEGEENEELGSILPRAIAGSILKQHGASQGTIRCRAHVPPAMETMENTGSSQREALEKYRDVYQAQVFVSAGGVELLKKSTTLEVAPVEGAPKP
ncbi:MAG TPA: hypothetical protein VGZ26_08905 [Pirellulales bacterium]|jgi:hypothetical protein|nr:hypothetical protein [Pirellulales bacterium]